MNVRFGFSMILFTRGHYLVFLEVSTVFKDLGNFSTHRDNYSSDETGHHEQDS